MRATWTAASSSRRVSQVANGQTYAVAQGRAVTALV